MTFLLAVLLLLRQDSGLPAYAIGAEDVLHVVVLGQTEMTGDFGVDRDGLLTFPVLGKVKAAGLTVPDLERKLTTLLADGYLKRPQVAVSVKEYRSQRVFVTGEVARPGAYPLKGQWTLRTLMGEVGNLAEGAGHEVVVIRPAPRGQQAAPVDSAALDKPEEIPGAEVFRVSLREVQSAAPAAELELRDGDTVHVPRAALIYVTGHVARQGSYRYQEGTSVLQALTLAGGLTERGSNKRLRVQRTVDGKPVEVKVKLTDPVLPGDTIIVPERFF